MSSAFEKRASQTDCEEGYHPQRLTARVLTLIVSAHLMWRREAGAAMTCIVLEA
jgi:hypothetical protein